MSYAKGSGLSLFQEQSMEWNECLSHEFQGWSKERARVVSLLQENRAEECFFLLADHPRLFASLFEEQDGFLRFHRNVPLGPQNRRSFCAQLKHSCLQSDLYRVFFEDGLWDRMILQSMGTEPHLSGIDLELVCAMSLRTQRIAARSFMMGALPRDKDALEVEKPRHSVTLSQAFDIGVYPCTQGLYSHVMKENYSTFAGALRPVENVCWGHAVIFCNKLSQEKGLQPVYTLPEGLEEMCLHQRYSLYGGVDPIVRDKWNQAVHRYTKKVKWNRKANGYRLPTDAEWECAARADDDTLYAGSDHVNAVGWHSGNSGDISHPVGLKKANGFGLHDMSGNVWEWVFDRGYRKYRGAKNNPLHTFTLGVQRGVRGSSWSDKRLFHRVSYRSKVHASAMSYFLGFRFVRNAEEG